MINKNLTYHRIENRSEEWMAFRQRGIGGSEVRTVLYADDYSDPLVLYYQKLGIKKEIRDNEAMFHGRNLEEYVAKCWEYYDDLKDEFGVPGYVKNMNEGTKIRRCKNLNAIVVNKKYPWLFANVDRIINKKGGFKLSTAEPLTEEGILEIKTTEGFAANKWEGGIDPSYLTQLNMYLLLMELEYGEIAVLKNGRYLNVYPFERNNEICNMIIEQTHDFWYNHVVPARKWIEKKAHAELIGDLSLVEECKRQIQDLEPPVGSNDAAEDFVKENYKRDKVIIDGTDELLEMAKKDALMASIAAELKKIKQQNKNEILLEFFHKECEYFDFGDMGKIRYFIKKGNTDPQLGNNIKIRFDKDEIRGLLTNTFKL